MGVSKGLWIAALFGGGVAALLALTWPAAPFASAALTAVEPPEILLDFEYPERMESGAFADRFKAGTAESDLIEWLRRNEFNVASGTSATRRYEGAVCTYSYHIEWQKKGDALQRDATARLGGYGCL